MEDLIGEMDDAVDILEAVLSDPRLPATAVPAVDDALAALRDARNAVWKGA